MKITKDMSILDIVQIYPETVAVLQTAGMGCIGCAASHFENIEQGAEAHGLNIDELLDDLNKAVDNDNTEDTKNTDTENN